MIKITIKRDAIKWDGDRSSIAKPPDDPPRHFIVLPKRPFIGMGSAEYDRAWGELERLLTPRPWRERLRRWRWRHSQDRWALWRVDFYRGPAGHYWRVGTPLFAFEVWNNFADFMTRDVKTGFELHYWFNTRREIGDVAFLRSIGSVRSAGRVSREWSPYRSQA